MPGAIDSNVPMTWALVEGDWNLFALTSWGGIPALLYGSGLTQMREAGPVRIVGHPGHGVACPVLHDESVGAVHRVPALRYMIRPHKEKR